MDLYSPYIKKYYKDITLFDYTISDNGSQLSKRMGCYMILITDLSIKGVFANTKTLLIWIKNLNTRTIEKEILLKHELLPLPFAKVDKTVKTVISGLSSDLGYNHYNESSIKDIVQDISI